MFALLKFIFFNSALNGSDIFTDFLTFVTFTTVSYHPNYAAISLAWMFVPFIIQLCQYAKAKWYRHKKDSTSRHIKKALLHFPFVLPLRNLYLAFRLFKLRFGFADFDPMNSVKVEAILTSVAFAGFYESYFEAGPQSVTQFVIILSTGNLEVTQIISIVISVFSLSWAASRGFFIQRPQDLADPDPALKMVLRILPLMMLVLLGTLAMWVCIAGLLGRFTFIAIFLNWLINYGVVKIMEGKGSIKQEKEGEKKKVQEESNDPDIENPEGIELVPQKQNTILKEESATKEAEENTKSDKFSLRASICSLWLPCIVGAQPKLFLVSALTSQATKAVTLAIAVTLALLGYQEAIHSNFFLFWCADDKTSIEEKANVTICSFQPSDGSEACFNWDSDEILQVKNILMKFLLLIIQYFQYLSSEATCLPERVPFPTLSRDHACRPQHR